MSTLIGNGSPGHSDTQVYSGDGAPARGARLAGPKGLALSGRRLYLADTESHTVRQVDLESGIIEKPTESAFSDRRATSVLDEGRPRAG